MSHPQRGDAWCGKEPPAVGFYLVPGAAGARIVQKVVLKLKGGFRINELEPRSPQSPGG
jgi:hypothetical protein